MGVILKGTLSSCYDHCRVPPGGWSRDRFCRHRAHCFKSSESGGNIKLPHVTLNQNAKPSVPPEGLAL